MYPSPPDPPITNQYAPQYPQPSYPQSSPQVPQQQTRTPLAHPDTSQIKKVGLKENINMFVNNLTRNFNNLFAGMFAIVFEKCSGKFANGMTLSISDSSRAHMLACLILNVHICAYKQTNMTLKCIYTPLDIVS